MATITLENPYCVDKLSSEFKTFNGVVGFCLLLSAVLLLISVFLRSTLLTRPILGSRVYYGFGAAEIALGVLLLTVLMPKCPTGCICANMTHPITFPVIVIILGLVSIRRGYNITLVADALARARANGGSITVSVATPVNATVVATEATPLAETKAVPV